MSSEVLGIVAPHPPIMVEAVGGQRAAVTSASIAALQQTAELLRRFDPDTVVLMSPHAHALSDVFLIDNSDRLSGSLAQFGAPEPIYSYKGDPELAETLLERLRAARIPAAAVADSPTLESGILDHGSIVPLNFLDRNGSFALVVLSLSWLPYDQHRTVGEHVRLAAEELGRRIAFIASGDCSHRLTRDAPAGYSPEGERFDRRLVELLAASDYQGLAEIDPDMIEAAGECGLRSFITLGGVVDDAPTRVLSYESPWGVGYLVALANEQIVEAAPESGSKHGSAGSEEHEIVTLARHSIEDYVLGRDVDRAPMLAAPELPATAGAFVSLHRTEQLRGCIGTIMPTRGTLAEEVAHNAIEAATRDPRFPSLEADELIDLDIKVDVLHAPEPCTIEDLNPLTYGVIVTSGFRRGLLLPDLEGVDTAEQQLAIATQKAGIAPGEPVEIERFRVDRYA